MCFAIFIVHLNQSTMMSLRFFMKFFWLILRIEILDHRGG
jgi:hypothetical protein